MTVKTPPGLTRLQRTMMSVLDIRIRTFDNIYLTEEKQKKWGSFRKERKQTPRTTPASYRVPPRERHLPTAFVRSGPQEDWVLKRGSYHSTTATSVRGSHGQTTRRAPPEAVDGRKTNRGGRSGQGAPGAELDGLSQGRLPSVRSHRRLYG